MRWEGDRQRMDDASKSVGIVVEDAPAIDGLTFRHFAGEDDYAAMWDVHTRSNVGYGLDEMVVPFQKFRHVNGASPNHNPEKDVIIAEVGGKMVAYMRTVSRP